MSERPGIKLDEADTVVTLLEDATAGDDVVCDGDRIEVATDVPFGHKVAIVPHRAGNEVYKYGEVIGAATDPIEPGEWVHTHNCESLRGQASAGDTEVTAE